jgi:phasin
MAGGTQGTGQTPFKVPDEMRNMAERSVTQARQALEGFLQAARRTTESMEQTSGKVQAGAKDAAQKTLSAVEQNLRTSLDYAQRLVRAKNLQEVGQIQSEFARTQTEAMQAQMKEYGSAMQSAMDTAKGVAQSAVEAMRDAAQTVAGAATQAKDRAAEAVSDTRDKGSKK